jgi:hypothetical protein
MPVLMLPHAVAPLSAWRAALLSVNSSKLLWGLTSVMLNLGSRFLITDVTPAQQRIFQHPVYKRLVVFCMMFAATRDVLLSVTLSCIVIVLLEGLLNEGSRFCVLPGARPAARPTTASPLPYPVVRSMVRGVVGATHHGGVSAAESAAVSAASTSPESPAPQKQIRSSKFVPLS